MNIRPLTLAMLLALLCASEPALSSSFRCGMRIVVVGDSVGRLMRSCGKPALKYNAKESIRENGKRQSTSVMHWVYERGRRKNMVVSVRSGKVVKIALE